MKISLDTNDRQFLERLHRLGTGSIQEICVEMDVTATAVRQRLTRLLGLKLVSRELARAGRGRPHHVYRVTETGRRELGDNYVDLAVILWRELRNIEEPELREHIVKRVKQAFVDRYGQAVRAETLGQRFEQLKSILDEKGFDVEVDLSGALPTLRENNCPYLELANSDPSICRLEQSVFEELLGADVALTVCCLEGHSYCEFQAVQELP